MDSPILSVRDLAAGYDRWPVIEGVVFDARPGTITAIVGPNASGKTTLFRGLFAHGAWVTGTILWNGIRVPNLRVRDVQTAEVAWVRQDRPVFPGLSVAEALSAALAAHCGTSWTARIERVLRRVPQVKDLLAQRMESLSGGQRALVSVATGLVGEPLLVCLDEPAAGLAPQTLPEVRQVLRDYVAGRGAACVVIEHRDEFISGLADVTIHLH